MKNENKKQVMFLFGAGAEGKGNFKLPMGYEYLKGSLFGNEYKTEITNALKQFFSETYFDDYKYTCHSYNNKILMLKNLITHKVLIDSEFLIDNIDKISTILQDKDFNSLKEDDELKKIIETYDIKYRPNELIKKELLESFGVVLGKKEDEPITNSFFKNLFSENDKENIDINIAVGGMLDNYFHTIISPTKYGKYNFSKIFNYYWFCYFILIENILKFFNNSKIRLKYYQNDNLDYLKIISDINNFTEMLYEIDVSDCGNTYYQLLKKAFENNEKFKISAISTTNYFRFCEILDENVIYLNGKLSNFEFPEMLEVQSAIENEFTKEKIFFPFIFGQSLVKPIINSEQINTFNSFKKSLNTSDILVVFGFNINEDDNHINSFLHEYVANGKQLIVVGENDSVNGKNYITKKLHCENVINSRIEYCTVKYGNNEEVVNLLMKTINKFND